MQEATPKKDRSIFNTPVQCICIVLLTVMAFGLGQLLRPTPSLQEQIATTERLRIEIAHQLAQQTQRLAAQAERDAAWDKRD